MTTAVSEKAEKQAWHRRWRRAIHQAIGMGVCDLDALSIPDERSLSNCWLLPKDGKYRFDPASHPDWMRK